MRKYQGHIISDTLHKNLDTDTESYLLNVRLHSYEFFEICKQFYSKEEIANDSFIDYKISVDYDDLEGLFAFYIENYLDKKNYSSLFDVIAFDKLQDIHSELVEYLKINNFET